MEVSVRSGLFCLVEGNAADEVRSAEVATDETDTISLSLYEKDEIRGVKAMEREKERNKDRERERKREREREKERKKQRQRKRKKQNEKERERKRERESGST